MFDSIQISQIYFSYRSINSNSYLGVYEWLRSPPAFNLQSKWASGCLYGLKQPQLLQNLREFFIFTLQCGSYAAVEL